MKDSEGVRTKLRSGRRFSYKATDHQQFQFNVGATSFSLNKEPYRRPSKGLEGNQPDVQIARLH